MIAQRSGELRLVVVHAHGTSYDIMLRSVSVFRSSVVRSAVPISCGDGTRRGVRTMSSINTVLGLIQDADGIEPALDVEAAIRARHADVFSHGVLDLAPRRVTISSASCRPVA